MSMRPQAVRPASSRRLAPPIASVADLVGETSRVELTRLATPIADDIVADLDAALAG